MSINQARIANLMLYHLAKTITPSEQRELDEWLTADPENQAVFDRLLQQTGFSERIMDFKAVSDIVDARWARIEQEQFNGQKIAPEAAKRVYKRLRVILFAAACAAAVLIGVFTLRYLVNPKKGTPSVAVVQPGLRNDVAPGTQTATLTLSDGSTISLDKADAGTVGEEGGTRVVKLDSGVLAYKSSHAPSTSALLYNTVSTPLGGQYQVVLPDGSQVWLNAGSSLRFPTSFSDTVREVSLTGEAYFEVAKSKTAPFKVLIRDNTLVKVLGTHFNVMAYADEPVIKTTLLEGVVAVSQDKQSAKILPGEQVRIEQGQLFLGKVDAAKSIAWMKGYFDFYDENISSIMRQVGRWYNVDIVYQGRPENRFSFTIRKDVKLSQLLALLEMTGKLKFAIDGRKVTVIAVS